MNFSSKLIEAAVDQFARLPGVGRKTAVRYVISLLKRENNEMTNFANTIIRLREEIKLCENCHNYSDLPLCGICSDRRRESGVVCVVEDFRDVLAIENTMLYRGVYHVLGGIISPMDGIGPSDLNIESLIERARKGEITEVVMALSTTIEGETTNFYIYKKLKDFNLSVSTIARGVAFGGELEYTDEVTLGKSIANRVPYVHTIAR